MEFDWGGREESFRQGLVANMQTWSVGAAGYSDPAQSKVVGRNGIVLAPVKQGMEPTYGVGGWGLAINADIEQKQQDAAWAYIKWVTSPKVQKEFNLAGASSYIRKSTLSDPELVARYPYLPVIAESFENGNGEYRPRIRNIRRSRTSWATRSTRSWPAARTPRQRWTKHKRRRRRCSERLRPQLHLGSPRGTSFSSSPLSANSP